jgi:hypothetical protein
LLFSSLCNHLSQIFKILVFSQKNYFTVAQDHSYSYFYALIFVI